VVKKIPKGKTLSYGEVSRRAGVIGAARAVGGIMSNNANKSIPCHRVVKGRREYWWV
jgi:methylated-DNA-[protein]-cysteine S-methyltransferase